MSRIDELISELCPNGVEYKELQEILTIKNGSDYKGFGEGDIPVYGSGGIMTYVDTFAFDKPSVLIPRKGSIDKLYYVDTPFWNVDTIFYTDIDTTKAIPRYVYHCLLREHLEQYNTAGGVPSLTQKVLNKIKIHVPPLEVQSEIVRILDNFTELTAELTAELMAELMARQKQYEYYRDMLLDFSVSGKGTSECEWRTLGEISSYRRGSFPQPYGNKEWYDGEDSKPFVQVADIADNMLLVDDTKRKISLKAQKLSVFAPKGSIIISLQGSIGRIAITQYESYIDRTVAIFTNIAEKLNGKYFVYQLQRVFAEKEKNARGSTIKTITKEEFTNFLIPVPPLAEQERIVEILDRFDKLCNDISEGLPAEIEARRKQYEYYRDKLLSFEELRK